LYLNKRQVAQRKNYYIFIVHSLGTRYIFQEVIKLYSHLLSSKLKFIFLNLFFISYFNISNQQSLISNKLLKNNYLNNIFKKTIPDQTFAQEVLLKQ
jgi:hypothetical protein